MDSLNLNTSEAIVEYSSIQLNKCKQLRITTMKKQTGFSMEASDPINSAGRVLSIMLGITFNVEKLKLTLSSAHTISKVLIVGGPEFDRISSELFCVKSESVDDGGSCMKFSFPLLIEIELRPI